jgi:hypothetical protein
MPNRLSAPMQSMAGLSAEPILSAARLVVRAARSLVTDPAVEIDAGRCRAIADSLARALARPHANAVDILKVSPFVYERSGEVKTIVEMIMNIEGDDATKFQMGRLLLRALDWR